VHGLIDEWGLNANDRILDPFCGAGTTPVAAKERGIPAAGFDLSPFAVFAAKVKLADYDPSDIGRAWAVLRRRIDPSKWNGASREYPELVKRALPGHLLGAFDSLGNNISSLDCSRANRDFFKMALLATLPSFSRAVASGGWLAWRRKRSSVSQIPKSFADRVGAMRDDIVDDRAKGRKATWSVERADARRLPVEDGAFSAVITSPPYPNRHDYTRVFGVELMFGFLGWEDTRRLRYQSFQSHPEAKPDRPPTIGYAEPKSLSRAVSRLMKTHPDKRVPPMLRGYFLDIFLSLREMKRACREGARLALVVGNAQYGGVPFMVDSLTAEIGEQVGLQCEKIVTVRYRGNSAQQMKAHGRRPSRESIVVFRISAKGAAGEKGKCVTS